MKKNIFNVIIIYDLVERNMFSIILIAEDGLLPNSSYVCDIFCIFH